MPLTLRIRTLALVATCAALLVPAVAGAQSLRGSRASIDRMYRQARADRLSFLETPAEVRRFVASGLLVRLESGASYEVHQVNFPYVRPATRSFVERLAVQYHAACGQRLVVTSAVRPATRQPANSTDRSVHPTGMAVDLRKPQSASCLRWLRSTLLELEHAGVIEATEESRPPHFHVAIFAAPYTRYAAARPLAAPAKRATASKIELASSSKLQASRPMTSATIAAMVATSPGAADPPTEMTTYVVRRGDSLWRIARTHDTTVDAIASANDLDGHAIKAGQALQIPVGG